MDIGALERGVFVTVFLAGLRHGFDLDHIAAITDITSAQLNPRRALMLASVYAVGHAVILLGLGLALVLWGQTIPAGFDATMGRAIGVTLVGLGLYVVYSLIRFRRDFRLQSRWMLVFAGVHRTVRWLRRERPHMVRIEHCHDQPSDRHEQFPGSGPALEGRVELKTRAHSHPHTHVVPAPSDPFTEYGVLTSLGVGMIHGVGAETPTQMLLITAAAGVAGSVGGLSVVVTFVAGLFLGNTILAVASAFGFAQGQRLSPIYMGLAVATAAISVYIGVAYLIERPGLLPGFLS